MNKIIYLDAAATYQKPGPVIDAQVDFLRNHYANSGRGICARAAYVDDMILRTRRRVADFMGANENQIVFTSGTTDGINIVAQMLRLNSTHRVAVSDLDHHSARLPFVATGAEIVVCPLDANCDIDINEIPYADVFVITAMSNVLGRAQNVAKIIHLAREKNPNVITVVDAAQFVVHEKIDANAWSADFICWSGHKIGADTGLGILYIKNPENYAPVFFGGGMVNKIVGDEIILSNGPDKFEAGTLPITQISGLVSAIDSLEQNRPDLNLIKYMYDELSNLEHIKILTSRDAAVLTFVVDNMHALDFGALIGARGVCVRVGNMCASWIHQVLDVSASIRISVGAYNTMDEVKTVVQYIKDIIK
ncbi:MAG: aminotransferase class V-fold PLP-dependent enzyme [Alphaproteobacteria bacterium]|nr:aminotransferase class V-fold PLP-dependent enzyme [Alphaproteobacteria bacterium]